MARTASFPGQVERLEFNLEQIGAIASSMRSEVFWAYSATEPLAVREVAARTNRSTGSVHYHTNALVQVGLLIPVAERKRRARTERLYVRAGRSVHGKPPPMEDQYRLEAGRGFDSIMRALGRERKTLHQVWTRFPGIESLALFRLLSLRLNRKDAALLKRRLLELAEEFEGKETPEGTRLRLAVILHPDMGELRKAHPDPSE